MRKVLKAKRAGSVPRKRIRDAVRKLRGTRRLSGQKCPYCPALMDGQETEYGMCTKCSREACN